MRWRMPWVSMSFTTSVLPMSLWAVRARLLPRSITLHWRQSAAIVFLNIGGVANLTWVGPDADPARTDIFDHLLAFDTGPGNALIDDWVQSHAGENFDQDGVLAAAAMSDEGVLSTLMSHDFFDAPPPKSLDRTDFVMRAATGLSLEDGAATLLKAVRFVPEPPVRSGSCEKRQDGIIASCFESSGHNLHAIPLWSGPVTGQIFPRNGSGPSRVSERPKERRPRLKRTCLSR